MSYYHEISHVKKYSYSFYLSVENVCQKDIYKNIYINSGY